MGFLLELDAPAPIRTAGRRPGNGHFGEYVHGGTGLGGGTGASDWQAGSSFLGQVDLAVTMFVFVVRVSSVRVAMVMSTEHDEANEVRGKAKAADDENEYRVTDDGWVEEPSKSFEDDRDA